MLALGEPSRNRDGTDTGCRTFDAGPSPAVRHAHPMRIRRHHHHEDHEREPVWTAGKPVWDEVRIEAPKAAELAAGGVQPPVQAA
jgi:hypothetical protein